MKNMYLYLLLAFLPMFSLIATEQADKKEAAESGSAKTQEDVAKTPESYSWENKKFSIGIEALNGFGVFYLGENYGTFSLESQVSLLQLNVRTWLSPNFQISLHYSFHWIIASFGALSMPLLLNVGYGKSIKDMYWFIEGGGGISNPPAVILIGCPVINAGAGIEWLVSKNYALGFNVKFSLLLPPYQTYLLFNKYPALPLLNLSITANLVL